ncbi:heterokaryon incompatibility protein-domain-containing protein [Pisolithus orientalis]|uniref:heterokaryon incompatibility protein-domain-containing protein n=1 Tax=Pisolithus orientalis TaxID=936130 RepID=UPI00222402EA|nr:heterokaryon incompatibility protein-domain-containing protein [Pisolithus orientalis]KAI6010813.1 heterokaryon incompatibility protein-domain-containing protein [Pisolithus orientalis]
MRLIDVNSFINFDARKAGPETKLLVDISGTRLEETEYAILSHCWEEPAEEVQYTEMAGLTSMPAAALDEIRERLGYKKILESSRQALHDDLEWLWVDTCCIDKQSSAELSEALNSMYAWHANADRCYALLHDIDAPSLPAQPDDKKFSESNGWPKWFSRGWTLQELIAPENVHFFNRNWVFIADKQSCAAALNTITRISVDVLEKGLGGTSPSVAQVMSWAADRKTTREEDRAYSLMGLFGVHMPMLYGEGKNAFLRLQLEVIRLTNDQSIFAWGWTRDTGWASSFLADDPTCFRDCSNIIQMVHSDFIGALKKCLPKKELRKLMSAEGHFQTFTVTNHGIQIWLPRQALKHDSSSSASELFSVMLACCEVGKASGPITVTMERFGPNYSRFFYCCPAVSWNQKSPAVEFQQIFLPC